MKNREIAGVKVFVSNDTYDEYKGTLQEQINKLQSNWNSLRGIIEDLGIDYLLDKMNELEGKDKE